VQPLKQKETVTLPLCKYLCENTHTFQKKRILSHKQILVYQCPKESCHILDREISFEKGKGFNNPYTHLLSPALLEVWKTR
jgi:hypothetical protein